MVYVYPQLSRYDLVVLRLLGPGLGNLLFPWARAVCLAEKYRLPLIYPTWPQLKLGSYIRGERDKQHYIGLFRSTRSYIRGATKLKYLAVLPRVTEEQFRKSPERFLQSHRDYVVLVTGLGRYFEPIVSDHALVKEKLLEIVRPERVPPADEGPFIALHVRLGDFKSARRATPLEFFEHCLSQLRSISKNAEIRIFTDGEDREVAPLLKSHGATIVRFGSAITDLLAMSRASVLIASGSSSFSCWGAYLGRMPVIWPADTFIRQIYADDLIPQIFVSAKQSLPEALFTYLRRTTLLSKQAAG